MKHIFILISVLATFLFFNDINIQWEDEVTGDFSFSKKQSMKCEAWCYEFAAVQKFLRNG